MYCIHFSGKFDEGYTCVQAMLSLIRTFFVDESDPLLMLYFTYQYVCLSLSVETICLNKTKEGDKAKFDERDLTQYMRGPWFNSRWTQQEKFISPFSCRCSIAIQMAQSGWKQVSDLILLPRVNNTLLYKCHLFSSKNLIRTKCCKNLLNLQ